MLLRLLRTEKSEIWVNLVMPVMKTNRSYIIYFFVKFLLMMVGRVVMLYAKPKILDAVMMEIMAREMM